MQNFCEDLGQINLSICVDRWCRSAMRSNLKWTQLSDFDYCARLFIVGMKTTIEELNLNLDAQVAGFRQR